MVASGHTALCASLTRHFSYPCVFSETVKHMHGRDCGADWVASAYFPGDEILSVVKYA
jgi:hypothetical protein